MRCFYGHVDCSELVGPESMKWVPLHTLAELQSHIEIYEICTVIRLAQCVRNHSLYVTCLMNIGATFLVFVNLTHAGLTAITLRYMKWV